MSPDGLLELFSDFGPVRARRMFGGTGFFADDLMFALEARGEVYLKADDALAADLAAFGSAPFSYAGKTREIVLPYWRLPDEAFEDDALRLGLFHRALDVARVAASRAPARRKATAKRPPAARSRR